MCGIFGYVGGRDVCGVLRQGLKALEYRGYDSAGMAVIGNSINYVKDAGTVDQVLSDARLPARRVGIAHTRWATHGSPNQLNAHPHFDCELKIAVVHNGIIENYQRLRKWLEARGHEFHSETDTEVVPHLIEEFLEGDEFVAFKKAVSKLEGSYAIAAIIDNSERIYFARQFSPLVLGVNGEMFVASDVVSFLKWTNRAVFIEDGEIGYLDRKGYHIERGGRRVERAPVKIEWSFEDAAKEGYEHFMLKEIFEQPRAVKETLADGRLVEFAEHLGSPGRLTVTAAGTSYHAGLVFKYLSRKPVEVIVASEFDPLYRGGEVLAISQSGETADTLKAVRHARGRGASISSLVNVVGSTLTRVADHVLYTHAGPEIGVAATKTFLSQVAALVAVNRILQGEELPQLHLEPVLKLSPRLRKTAHRLSSKRSMFYLGRGLSYAIALEGALKMKELAYIHAEAYPGGELKHGPLALIEEGVPVVAVCPPDEHREKMLGNIEEVRSRGARVIALGERGDRELEKLADEFYGMPSVEGDLVPLYYTVPLQLLSYHTAVLLGRNPDKPRNLAKSVTVE